LSKSKAAGNARRAQNQIENVTKLGDIKD